MSEPHLICTCLECGKTWEVDFEPVPCECEASQYFGEPEWVMRVVEYDD